MWKSLSGNARFSILAFAITASLGLLSMGALGAVLYYPVSFLLNSYPSLNAWTGDWVWPAMISVGMFWSLGFVIAGIVWHYLSKVLPSHFILYIIYIFILWS